MTGFPGVAPPNFVKDGASRKIPAQDYRNFVFVSHVRVRASSCRLHGTKNKAPSTTPEGRRLSRYRGWKLMRKTSGRRAWKLSTLNHEISLKFNKFNGSASSRRGPCVCYCYAWPALLRFCTQITLYLYAGDGNERMSEI